MAQIFSHIFVLSSSSKKTKIMKLILTNIFLNANESENQTFDIWYNSLTEMFFAYEIDGAKRFQFKLKESFESIVQKNREEILEYRLGRITEKDIVSIGDVFMHGKFIEQISI
jgi:hypothetical protein